MKRVTVALAALAATVALAACGETFPSLTSINGACDGHGGAAYIAQHEPKEEEGHVTYIERCRDNLIVVVK